MYCHCIWGNIVFYARLLLPLNYVTVTLLYITGPIDMSMVVWWCALMCESALGAVIACHRADFRLAPSQWETSLQSNAVSHWLGENLESALLLPVGWVTLWDVAAFNTLRLRQNGRHFPDNIFRCIFFNENVSIFIKYSLKFVAKGLINNIPALVQIMAWWRPGNKHSFSEGGR